MNTLLLNEPDDRKTLLLDEVATVAARSIVDELLAQVAAQKAAVTITEKRAPRAFQRTVVILPPPARATAAPTTPWAHSASAPVLAAPPAPSRRRAPRWPLFLCVVVALSTATAAMLASPLGSHHARSAAAHLSNTLGR